MSVVPAAGDQAITTTVASKQVEVESRGEDRCLVEGSHHGDVQLTQVGRAEPE